MGDIHGWLLSDGCIYLAAARSIRAACAAVFIWRWCLLNMLQKAYTPIFFASVFHGMAFDVIGM